MASGDLLMKRIPPFEPPAASNAHYRPRNMHPAMRFALTEEARITDYLPGNYAGGGVTISIQFAMVSAVADDINLETSFERIEEGVLDIDADSFAAAQSTGDITVPGTAGITDVITVAHTDGAQMDSLAAGELYRINIERVAVAGTDATGDLEILAVWMAET